jgi:hypothetical protein
MCLQSRVKSSAFPVYVPMYVRKCINQHHVQIPFRDNEPLRKERAQKNSAIEMEHRPAWQAESTLVDVEDEKTWKILHGLPLGDRRHHWA